MYGGANINITPLIQLLVFLQVNNQKITNILLFHFTYTKKLHAYTSII